MKFKISKKNMLFLTIYTIITTMLIINTVRYKLLVDIIYTAIFIGIYFRYLYINIFS